MTQFVRIGDEGYQYVINLALVIFAELTEYDNRGCVALYFAGNDWPVRIYAGKPGYTDLLRWMDEQQLLSTEVRPSQSLEDIAQVMRNFNQAGVPVINP